MYRLEPDGPLMYPSITTVAGMRAKDFLQGWYATMASKRALEMYSWLDRNPHRAPAEISRVTRDRWGTQKRIAAAAEEYTRTAADFGTLVHAACEEWGTSGSRPDADVIGEIVERMRTEQGCFASEKDPQALLNRVAVRLDGYARFLDDFQPEFLEVEQTVVNHSVGYAGTTDAIVKIGNTQLSADIKTSKKVRGDYALQGVAVCRAEMLLDEDGTTGRCRADRRLRHPPAGGGGYGRCRCAPVTPKFEVFRSLRQLVLRAGAVRARAAAGPRTCCCRC